jgi:hypothetical protein
MVEELESRLVPSTWSTFGEGSVSGNTVTVGVAGRSENGQQPIAFHGASAQLCAAREYVITFEYNLFTWDSYNADTGNGTGYWDSFSVSITSVPYPQLAILTDPLQFPNGFVQGGTRWGDGVLERYSGTKTIRAAFNVMSPKYLNLVLDTTTQPTADDLYPSWGTFTIRSVAAVCGVQEVTFAGDHQFDVTSDDSMTTYSGPHWLDNNLNSRADDPGDHKYPTVFAAGSTMKVSAKLALSDVVPLTGNSWMVRGDGPGNLDIPATSATVSGRFLTITNVAAANPFSNAIDVHDSFTISWEVSPDGGQTWVKGPRTTNQVYVTLKDPIIDGNTPHIWHTVVDVGSRSARGQTDENTALDRVWAKFATLNVQRVENPVTLTYYNSYLTVCTRTAELLQSGDGQCGSWTSFFLDTLKVLGLTMPKTYLVVVPKAATNANGFLVKNWNFAGAGQSGDADFPYLNLPAANLIGNNTYNWRFAEVTDATGIAGQGNNNPASLFNNHQIALVNGTYYDASYGVTYTSLDDMDNRSIAGYFTFRSNYPVRESLVNLDLNQDGTINNTIVPTDVMLVKQNPAGGDLMIDVALPY